jgi:hypothetical protein
MFGDCGGGCCAFACTEHETRIATAHTFPNWFSSFIQTSMMAEVGSLWFVCRNWKACGIAAPFEREKTRDAREKFVDIQAVIEAVDRAIEDEED